MKLFKKIVKSEFIVKEQNVQLEDLVNLMDMSQLGEDIQIILNLGSSQLMEYCHLNNIEFKFNEKIGQDPEGKNELENFNFTEKFPQAKDRGDFFQHEFLTLANQRLKTLLDIFKYDRQAVIIIKQFYLLAIMSKLKTMKWEIEITRLIYIQKILDQIIGLQSHIKYFSSQFEDFYTIFPPVLFEIMIKQTFRLYKEGSIMRHILKFQNSIIKVYNIIYVTYPMRYMAKVLIQDVSQISPQMKEHVRQANKQVYSDFMESMSFQNTTISIFINNMTEKFLNESNFSHQQPKDDLIFTSALQLINDCFCYGLYEETWIDALLSQLFLISQTILQLETQIDTDHPLEESQSLIGQFAFCRYLFSNILIHLAFAFSQDDIDYATRTETKLMLKDFILSHKVNSQIYVEMVLTYIFPGGLNQATFGKSRIQKQLENTRQMLLNFLVNFESDFFSQGLRKQPSYQLAEDYRVINQKISDIASNFNCIYEVDEQDEKAEFINRCKNFVDICHDFCQKWLFKHSFIADCLSFWNIPHMLLQIFIISKNNKDKWSESLAESSRALIVALLRRSTMSLYLIFGYSNKKLYAYLLKDLPNDFIPVLNYLWLEFANFAQYSDWLLEKLIKCYESFINSCQNDTKHQDYARDQLTQLFYNSLLYNTICYYIDYQKGRKNYDLMIQWLLHHKIIKRTIKEVKERIRRNRGQEIDRFKFMPFMLENLKPFSEQMVKEIQILESDVDISFLRLFELVTREGILGPVYTEYKDQFSIKIEARKATIQKVLDEKFYLQQLEDRFNLFYNNQLISNRFSQKQNEQFGYQNFELVPKNTNDAQIVLIDNFKWLLKAIKLYGDSKMSKQESNNIMNFFINGILPMCYQYLKGVLNYSSVQIEPNLVGQMSEGCNHIGILFKEIFEMIESRTELRNNSLFITLQEKCNKELRRKNQCDIITYKAVERKKQKTLQRTISSIVKAPETMYEFMLDGNDGVSGDDAKNVKDIKCMQLLQKLHHFSSTVLDMINSKPFLAPQLKHLKKYYQRKIEFAPQTKFSQKYFRSYESFWTNGLDEQKARLQQKLDQTSNIAKRIVYNYRISKLKLIDKGKKYTFLQQLDEMSQHRPKCLGVAKNIVVSVFSFTQDPLDGLQNSILVNNDYLQNLVNFNNLFDWNEQIRQQIYAFLDNNSQEDGKKTFIQQLWGLYINLLSMAVFKPFTDKLWMSYWGKFYLVAKSFQNICENNFVSFKEVMQNKPFGLIESNMEIKLQNNSFQGSSEKTVYQETLYIIKMLSRQTTLWQSKETQLQRTDRPDLIQVISILFNNLSEMVGGKMSLKAICLHQLDFPILQGIIFRYIEQMDSQFYKLQFSCISFINQLLEQGNADVSRLFISNFPVKKLYNQMILLARNLYLDCLKKQDRSILGKIAHFFKQVFGFRTQGVFPISSDGGQYEHLFKDPEQIVTLYIKSSDFYSSQIIDIVIQLYIMIENMELGSHYSQLFFDQKKKYSENYEDAPDRAEAVMMNFIERIIGNVEILYFNENGNEEEAENYVAYQGEASDTESLSENVSHIRKSRTSVTGRKKKGKTINSRIIKGKSKTVDVKNQEGKSMKTQQSISLDGSRVDEINQSVAEEDNSKPSGFYQLRRYYFKPNPICFNIDKAMQDDFDNNMPITNLNDKRLYLYNMINVFQSELQQMQFLSEKSKILAYMCSKSQFYNYQYILLVLSIIVNLILLIVGIDSTFSDYLVILGLVIAIIASVVLVSWFAFMYPLKLRQLKFTYPHKITNVLQAFDFYVYQAIIIQQTPLIFFSFACFSFFGYLGYRFFFTLNVLISLFLFRDMQNVMRAITDNGFKFIAILALLAIVTYPFSYIVQRNYADNFQNIDSTQNACNSLFECFANSLNYALRAGAGYIEIMTKIIDVNTWEFWGYFVISFLYFFLIKLVLLNIIAGIIIDAFGKLRDENTKRVYQQNYICFICGYDKWEVEKRDVDFNYHTTAQHSKWEYVNFLLTLLNQNKNELNVFEDKIWSNFENWNTDWIPPLMFLKDSQNFKIIKNKEIDLVFDKVNEDND